MDKMIIDKLNEFVDKIKSKEWEIDKSANQIILEDGEAVLSVWLAKRMSDFELAKKPQNMDADLKELLDPNWKLRNSEYENTVEEFNEMVNQATIHRVIIDNKLKKELRECKEKCSALEKALENSKSLNTKLVEGKMESQRRLDRIYEIHPKLKEDLDIPESEITDE